MAILCLATIRYQNSKNHAGPDGMGNQQWDKGISRKRSAHLEPSHQSLTYENKSAGKFPGASDVRVSGRDVPGHSPAVAEFLEADIRLSAQPGGIGPLLIHSYEGVNGEGPP